MSDKPYTLDAYVLDTLMRDLVGHDHRASAFLVYLALSTLGESRPRLSHAQLAERTGLSKRSVQAAVIHLTARELIRRIRSGPTEVTRYEVLTPWRRGIEHAPGL